MSWKPEDIVFAVALALIVLVIIAGSTVLS